MKRRVLASASPIMYGTTRAAAGEARLEVSNNARKCASSGVRVRAPAPLLCCSQLLLCCLHVVARDPSRDRGNLEKTSAQENWSATEEEVHAEQIAEAIVHGFRVTLRHHK